MNHISKWTSQIKVNDIYLGNLQLASSIVFSGGTFQSFCDMAHCLKLQIFSNRTLYALQNKYIYGAVNNIYKEYRSRIFNQHCGSSLRLSGDGRCDSPGHTAKYGTYSVIIQNSSQILHFHLACAAQTEGKSTLMEKIGFRKSFREIKWLQYKNRIVYYWSSYTN